MLRSGTSLSSRRDQPPSGRRGSRWGYAPAAGRGQDANANAFAFPVAAPAAWGSRAPPWSGGEAGARPPTAGGVRGAKAPLRRGLACGARIELERRPIRTPSIRPTVLHIVTSARLSPLARVNRACRNYPCLTVSNSLASSSERQASPSSSSA